MKARLFYCGIVPALFFQVVGALLYFVWDNEWSQLIYGATKLLLLVWPLLWLGGLRIIRFEKHSPQLLLSLGLGILMCAPIFAIYFVYQDLFTAASFTEKATDFGLTSPAFFIAFAVLFSAAHSLLEEYYWRYFVFRGLTIKLKWVPAALVASVAFAGHHYFVLSEFFPLHLTLLFGTAVGVGGFLWCALYRQTGSLLGSWLSHAMVDASLMTVGYFLLF